MVGALVLREVGSTYSKHEEDLNGSSDIAILRNNGEGEFEEITRYSLSPW